MCLDTCASSDGYSIFVCTTKPYLSKQFSVNTHIHEKV